MSAALRPCWADSPRRISLIRIGSPACVDRGQAVRRGRKYTGGAQERGSSERSSRSPVEKPAFVSSPTISAAEVSSSVPPGGRTGPRARSLSLSKPCRGTGCSAGALGAGAGGVGCCRLHPRGTCALRDRCGGFALAGAVRLAAAAAVPWPALLWARMRRRRGAGLRPGRRGGRRPGGRSNAAGACAEAGRGRPARRARAGPPVALRRPCGVVVLLAGGAHRAHHCLSRSFKHTPSAPIRNPTR